MAFKRIIELSVGSDGTGLLISDLHMEFNIERSNTISENIAEFIIYNARERTRKNILRKGNNIIFKYGYEDESIGTLFIGNITDSKSMQSGSDWVTTITSAAIQSQNTAITNKYVTLSYAEDTLLSKPLEDIANILGLFVYGLDNAAINLENGFTFVGSTRGALKYCEKVLKAHDVALFVDNNTIVIFKIGGRTSRFSPVYLDYNSGLINVDDITEHDNQSKEKPKRISFRSLIIPKLHPNGLIVIPKKNKLEGTYLIEKVNFSGDNFGGSNECNGEAIE